MNLQEMNIGENYVYHTGPRGWQDVPKATKDVIMGWVNEGKVTHFIRRRPDRQFDMVIQRLKSKK